MTTLTQVQRVLRQLQSGRTLTSAQARSMGIQRLPARIHEIREELGVNVQSTPFTNRNGQRVVKYALASKSNSSKSRSAR